MAQANLGADDIAAICVDTTCCTVVALDAEGAPLRPAIMWCDMRAAKQAAAVAACGAPELRVNGGGAGPVSAEWMVGGQGDRGAAGSAGRKKPLLLARSL
jgi:sugar (pentulose or hexulose) kinase